MYLCMMHIGRQYEPGEFISDIEPEFAERLIKAGAIEKVASAADEPEAEPVKEEVTPEIDVMAGIGEAPKKRSKKK